MIVCGIDSGAQGAVAFLDSDTGDLLLVEDLPIDRVQVGKHARSRVARRRLLDLLLQARGAAVFVERPEGRPLRQTNKKTGMTETRQPGAAGMMSMGENYGSVIMGCTAADMSVTEVRPGTWKRSISVPAAKDDARRRATELFPSFADRFTRVKDDGRSEACLIAYYGSLVLKGRFHAEAAD